MLDFILARVGPRKRWLLACGLVRQIWDQLRDHRSKEAVEAAERRADGQATDDELHGAWVAALDAHFRANWDATLAAHCAVRVLRPDESHLRDLLRDARKVLARKPALERARSIGWRHSEGTPLHARAVAGRQQVGLFHELFGNPFRPLRLDPTWRRWHDGVVDRLARGVYQEQRFSDMPVLGDALEDAGCEDDDVLHHCRAPLLHVRGCHVLDAILGLN
jgi:hypothetical protein